MYIYLDMFEYLRRPERKRKRKELILNVTERASILMVAGHSINEIVNATMQVEEIQKQRRETLQKEANNNNGGWERLAQILEQTGRLPKEILNTTGDILTSTGGKLLNGDKNSMGGGGGGKQPRTVPARSA